MNHIVPQAEAAFASQIAHGWGAPASARYEQLAARFRPIFADIRATALENETNRVLPFEHLRRLRDAGFSRLRLPASLNGSDATLGELFNLVIELGAADTSVVNAFRAHLGVTEDLLNAPQSEGRDFWLRQFADDKTAGSGFTELGSGAVTNITTTVTRDGDGFRVNGRKFYTSGSLFADYVNIAAVGEDGQPFGAFVPSDAQGVTILDDWDGWGQQLSASGTAIFDNVRIQAQHASPIRERTRYSVGFYQLIHVASLAGIARAASDDVARLVAERSRVYAHGNADRAAEDPQILAVVGRVHSAAYAAGSIVVTAANALQRAYEARLTEDQASWELAGQQADLEVSQAVTVVSDLVLHAVTELFDALGASAAKKGHGLDRYWRNARTIASHNPRIYHQRSVGNFAVNDVLPAFLWGRAGKV